jgi:tRNA-2-methylthio-N6-dimethylallyladenosine synthase
MAVEIKKISEQELDEQKQFADKTKALLNERYNGKQPLACVVTYGCQQNVADSEKIKGMLEEMG